MKKKKAAKLTPKKAKAKIKKLATKTKKTLTKKFAKIIDVTQPAIKKIAEPVTKQLYQEDSVAIEIIRRVRNVLAPTTLSLKNLSQLHAKHKESKKSGGGHYSLNIVSEAFSGLGLKERHSWVMSLMEDMFNKGIHALKLDLKEPSEVPLKENLSEPIRPVVKRSLKKPPTSP